MKLPQEPLPPSRRDFFAKASRATAVLSAAGLLAEPGQPRPQQPPDGSVVIHVSGPAGPAPLGAPVDVSIPFPPGRLRSTTKLSVHSPDGEAVLAQFRSGLDWPDGSVRWLLVVFEAAGGPGDYLLQEGETAAASDLVTEKGDAVVIDTGGIGVSLQLSGQGWIRALSAPGPDGIARFLANGPSAADLVLLRHDGTEYRASLDGGSRHVTVEERGPLRACVRVEGQCRSKDGDGLFTYILRCTAFRDRPDLHLQITWINSTDRLSEQLKDIRLTVPFGFDPERLVIGCESGVYDGPFLRDWPTYVLQEDYNWYWARNLNPDGRIQNLSSGGCNGERAPGWLYVRDARNSVGIWVPRFWEEYPNEISVRQGELSVGLWPQRATAHLLTKPLLPANPQGTPYTMTDYRPIIPHPYWAFLDADKKSLDVPQGMAKTQEIVLSLWAGKGEAPTFEPRWWRKALSPVRGHLDPRYVSGTTALGHIVPRAASRLPELEGLFDESYGWLNRHIDFMRCYGKFDYGDFKYFTPATDYLCTPGTKWGRLGEMPREGYWQNNEGDQLLGLILYYFRTGEPAAWERCRIVARHLLDVDLRHYPYFGLYTHGYGHCYVTTASAGEPDHSWLLGLWVWAGISGDPTARDWVLRSGEYMSGLNTKVIERDARTASVQLHMMCQFYRDTGRRQFLAAAQVAAEILLKYQNPDGSWPAYLGNPERRTVSGFADHAVMALADFYSLTGSEKCVEPLKRACRYVVGPDGIANSMDVSPLAIYALALFSDRTADPGLAEAALKGLEKLRATQDLSNDPYGRGDTWAQFGVNNPTGAKATGRPPQFLGQTRPGTVGFVLSYGQPALAMAVKTSAKPRGSPTPGLDPETPD
jgi:hypothetical protein